MTHETLRELLDRAERDGWTKGLAYRVAKEMYDEQLTRLKKEL